MYEEQQAENMRFQWTWNDELTHLNYSTYSTQKQDNIILLDV